MTRRAPQGSAIDPQWFRSVLGQYPTGVCVVTALDPETGPAGMVVGSFTSVSLDPPLVAFFPDRSSTTWPKIRRAGSFCVNILGADQEAVCRSFSSKAPDKFAGHPHRPGPTGSPVLEGTVAWIDCDLESVTEAGDHFIVLGRVRQLDLEQPRLPLLFFQGGYGRFTHSSLVAADERGVMTHQLRYVELVRPELERLRSDLGCRSALSARVGDEVVIVASSGGGPDDEERGTLVGQRLPYVPPTGSVFAAWSDGHEVGRWLDSTRGLWLKGVNDSEEAMDRHRRALDTVRSRGYSLGLLSISQRAFAAMLDIASQDPGAVGYPDLFGVVQNLVYDPEELTADARRDVRQISAPVFDHAGKVVLAVTIYDFGHTGLELEHLIGRITAAAARSTAVIGGRAPADEHA